MFVDCQTFVGLLGRDFLGKWFVAIQYRTFITLLNARRDVNREKRIKKPTNIDLKFNIKTEYKSCSKLFW